VIGRIARQLSHQQIVGVAHGVIRQHRQQVVERVVAQAKRRPELGKPFPVGKRVGVQQLIDVARRRIGIIRVAVGCQRAHLVDRDPEQVDEIDLAEHDR